MAGMHRRRNEMRDRRGRVLAVAVLLTVLTGCGGESADEPPTSAPTTTSSPTLDSQPTPFPNSADPVAVDPGTYSIPSSEWSVVDYAVTIPDGWEAQYGQCCLKHSDTDEELGFYAVAVDEIFADACDGSDGEPMDVGPRHR
jgi:hypothetical protein